MENHSESPVQRTFELTPIQVRVLGAMLEKKETTPDQYPLTLNSLRNACNQKSARQPVTSYTEGEVGRTVRELQESGLVRETWGARVAKYEHVVGKAWQLHGRGLALMCVLMLRGPQTLGELRSHSHRLFEFEDLEDVRLMLDRLIEQVSRWRCRASRAKRRGGSPTCCAVSRNSLNPRRASHRPNRSAGSMTATSSNASTRSRRVSLQSRKNWASVLSASA